MREVEVIRPRLHTKYCVEVSQSYEFTAVEIKKQAVEPTATGLVIRLKGTMDRA